MSDAQAQPSRSERDQLEQRITRVASQGLISEADRDIRLGNVRSAQSRTELDLMNRDLDQLEAARASSASDLSSDSGSPTPPYSAFDPSEAAGTGSGAVVASGRRRPLIIAVVVALLALLVSGGAGLFAVVGHSSSTSSTSARALPPAQTDGADPQTDGADPQTDGADPQTQNSGPTGYSLTAAGVDRFLAMYAAKFHTERVVGLVMYPDYVVADVPVAGGRGRQAGWTYRTQTGWSRFGQERAVFPGASTVDIRQLDVAALMRNVSTATRTLEVEDPNQTYVIVRYVPTTDHQPVVDIYVSNRFNESGYLATRLDGSVVRSYPFQK